MLDRDLHIIRQLYSKRRTARVLFFKIGYYEKFDTDMFFYRYPSFSSIDDKQGRTGNHFIKKTNIREKNMASSRCGLIIWGNLKTDRKRTLQQSKFFYAVLSRIQGYHFLYCCLNFVTTYGGYETSS
jgi:hypothetical protein